MSTETPEERHARLLTEAREQFMQLVDQAAADAAWGEIRIALSVQAGRIQCVKSALERAHK